MVRDEATQTKVHYKGTNEDFIVFVDDFDLYNKWKSDSSIPLAHFVSTFKIFLTHKQGAQGTYDVASKVELAAEFNTEYEDEVLETILQKGEAQNMAMPARQSSTNDSKGTLAGH